MNIDEIKELMELFENSGLCELKYKNEQNVLHMKKPGSNEMSNPIFQQLPFAAPLSTGATPEKTQMQAAETVKGEWVKAPFVGVFYSAASENSAPFVKTGQRVSKGDTLCILEAMKIMNEIKAPIDGVIKEIKAQNGKLVEFDEEMILIGE